MARGVLKTFIYVVMIVIIIYIAKIFVERYIIETNIFRLTSKRSIENMLLS
jgi:hypothetical protein